MKKLIVIFILFAGAYQLKAQQLFQAKPADSLSNKLLDNYLKIKPNNPWQPLLNPNGALSVVNTKSFGIESVFDHMPVVVLEGYSKMPVVKLGGYYTMPIKRMDDEGHSLNLQKSLPGLPAFKSPGQ